MRFEYPSQRLQDWLSQQWVMARGRRVEPREIEWLFGPFGEVDVVADHYLDSLAQTEGLVVERRVPHVGMVDELEELIESDAAGVDERVRAFYENTSDYEMEVWSEWSALFRPFGFMLRKLYSLRFQQLNLPMRPLDTALGITSEIAVLRTPDGAIRYRVWYRTMKGCGDVIFSGIYTTTQVPDGRRCVKAAFPLPRGNATVIMAVTVGDAGDLRLSAKGRRFGDPGFYFLLRNRRGRHWGMHVRAFCEHIRVYVDGEKVLRADHALTLWGWRVMRLHYKIMRRVATDADRRTPEGASVGVATPL